MLASLPADAVERMIQYISVLHYYAGEGVIGAPQYGEAYNRYGVYAVQNYVWYICNPNQTDLWYTIRPLAESEQWNVQWAFSKIMQKAYELYGDGRLTGFELSDGGAIQRFQTGDTVRQGNFSITNTGSGVSITITGRRRTRRSSSRCPTGPGTTVETGQPLPTIKTTTSPFSQCTAPPRARTCT